MNAQHPSRNGRKHTSVDAVELELRVHILLLDLLVGRHVDRHGESIKDRSQARVMECKKAGEGCWCVWSW